MSILPEKRLSRLYPLLCLILLGLTFQGCKKNEFDVTFELPEDVNEVYTTIYYASDPEKGRLIEGVVSVQKGKGALHGWTNRPTLLYILLPGSSVPSVAYVERGDKISVKGKGSDPAGWEIRGNALTDQLSEWRLRHAKELGAFSAGDAGTSAALNSAVAASVRKSPDAPLSALLTGLYYDRRTDRQGYDTLMKLLKGKAADSQWQQLVSRADMLEYPTPGGDAKEIILRSLFTGCDTVRFGQVPVMIVFGRSSDATYSDDMKQLRDLSREFRDSTKRVIVNICTDTDSLTTLSACRRDSLWGAISAWAPMGVSDAAAVGLGVPRVPWEIVIGRDGKRVYDGDSMEAAVKAMREASR